MSNGATLLDELAAEHEAVTDVSVLRCRTVADVPAEELRWLWPGRLPAGKVSLIAGDPGLGKSLLTTAMASHVTRGTPWPVDRSRCPAGSVVMVSAEDDVADTIRPRLTAAGANLRKVHVIDDIDGVGKDGEPRRRAWTLADTDMLASLVLRFGDVRLIVIDPISAYLGRGVDGHANSEVRAALAPLTELAQQSGAAVVLVSHLNKTSGTPAAYRITGSLAFSAAARAVFAVTKDKDDSSRRLVLPVKCNLSADRAGVAYRVKTSPEGVPVIEWEDEPVNLTADEAMQPDRPGPEPEERREAADWLTMVLADGAVPVKELKAQARDAGFSWGTIRRAKDDVGVKARKQDFSRGWVWHLAEGAQEGAHEDAHQPPTPNNLRTFGGTCASSRKSESYGTENRTEKGVSDEGAQGAQVIGSGHLGAYGNGGAA